MRKVFLFLSIGSLLLSSACKKSDTTNTTCPLSTATLVGAYLYTGQSIQENANSPVVNQFASYPPCEQDDILTLKSDGTYTWTDGVLVCGTRPNGTWSLTGTTMRTDTDFSTVTSFDCKTLVLTTLPGEYPKEVSTYVRQ